MHFLDEFLSGNEDADDADDDEAVYSTCYMLHVTCMVLGRSFGRTEREMDAF